LEPITSALLQVFVWLLATVGLLAAMEAVLYWLLYRFRSPLFWPVVAVVAALVALAAGHLGRTPAPGADADVVAPFNQMAAATAAVVFLAVAGLFQTLVKGRQRIAIMMLAPAFLAVSLLVLYPFFFEFRLAFANLNMYSIGKWINTGELGFVGLENFKKVFTTSPLQTATFWELLARTFAWTGINLVFHVGFGLALAMLLNREVRFKGLYRTILILPWAIPQVVAILAWRGEFHPQFGFVNQLLGLVGLPSVNWWSDPIPVFLSCCIVNIWLGIPFMMIVFLGGLQSIPRSYYEAASIDGASKATQFFQITVPMLKPVVVPSITLGTIWTFNNINVIYLMTGQDGGNEYADILVSARYKSAFTYSRYSFSAAFALVIFGILISLTLLWMALTRGTESATA
jgi:arabinogalactan oligomer/maltooligosaccharide transport system permease protein